MRNVKMLHTELNFVCIPVETAIYCENCRKVSNSSNSRCGSCGSSDISRLTMLLDGPPSGPESGPAPSTCFAPDSLFELPRVA
jgi:hypothetical protein